MNPAESVLSALRRADQAFFEQLAQVDALDMGSAYYCGAHPESADANQLRDASLARQNAVEAYESVERYYAGRNLTCLRWSPAAGEPIEPHAALLEPRGWGRVEMQVCVLVDWPSPERLAPAVRTATGGSTTLRIISGRAMRRALRGTVLDADAGRFDAATRAAQADELSERMNDANFDALVALIGDEPAGRIVYHEVGDIAALRDLYVVAAHRRRGVGRALLAHAVQQALRLAPRICVTRVDAANCVARRLVESFGFRAEGTLVSWERGLR